MISMQMRAYVRDTVLCAAWAIIACATFSIDVFADRIHMCFYEMAQVYIIRASCSASTAYTGAFTIENRFFTETLIFN